MEWLKQTAWSMLSRVPWLRRILQKTLWRHKMRRAYSNLLNRVWGLQHREVMLPTNILLGYMMRKPIVILLFLCTLLEAADINWRSLPIRTQAQYDAKEIGGEGMQISHCLTRSQYNPNYIYMSMDAAGLWRSRDNGDTWEKPEQRGLFESWGESVKVDPINPDIVFFLVHQGTGGALEDYEGLYKSTDGGDTWAFVLNIESDDKHEGVDNNIDYDPTSISEGKALRWYVGSHINGLYRSEDGGDTWTRHTTWSDLGKIGYVWRVACHPTDGQTVWIATEDGAYISEDRGTTVTLKEAGWAHSLAINPDDPDIIFIAKTNSGLFRSVDGGDSFSEILDWNKTGLLFMNPGFPNKLYLTHSNSYMVKVSEDGGDTWTTVTGAVGKVNCPMVPNPVDVDEAVAQSNASPRKTTDGGLNWSKSATLFTGYYPHRPDGIVFDPSDPNVIWLFCADIHPQYTDNRGDFFVTRGGTRPNTPVQWDADGLAHGKHGNAGDVHPENSNILVASIGHTSRAWHQLMYTSDAGVHWELLTSPEQLQHFEVQFSSDDPNYVYSGNKVSSDGGRTFSNVSRQGLVSQVIQVAPSDPTVSYGWSNFGQVLWRSDDSQESWTQIYKYPGGNAPVWKHGNSSRNYFVIHPADPNIFYSRGHSTFMPGEVAKGVWDGESTTWTDTDALTTLVNTFNGDPTYQFIYDARWTSPLVKENGIVVDSTNPNTIYVKWGGTKGIPLIYKTTDGGNSWTDITGNLSRLRIGGMRVNPHTGELFVGTFFGVWVHLPAANADWKLTTSSDANGIVAIPGEGDSYYMDSDIAHAVAVPNFNYTFSEWTGTAVDAGKVDDVNLPAIIVEMAADYTLKANFIVKARRLTVSSGNNGSVAAPGEDTYYYDDGDRASILAVPSAGWKFSNWTGTAVDAGKVNNTTNANTRVQMDDDYTVVANFVVERTYKRNYPLYYKKLR